MGCLRHRAAPPRLPPPRHGVPRAPGAHPPQPQDGVREWKGRKRVAVQDARDLLGLPHVGHAHRGIDDARNLARIAQATLAHRPPDGPRRRCSGSMGPIWKWFGTQHSISRHELLCPLAIRRSTRSDHRFRDSCRLTVLLPHDRTDRSTDAERHRGVEGCPRRDCPTACVTGRDPGVRDPVSRAGKDHDRDYDVF
jgi:hypothetical protein